MKIRLTLDLPESAIENECKVYRISRSEFSDKLKNAMKEVYDADSFLHGATATIEVID